MSECANAGANAGASAGAGAGADAGAGVGAGAMPADSNTAMDVALTLQMRSN